MKTTAANKSRPTTGIKTTTVPNNATSIYLKAGSSKTVKKEEPTQTQFLGLSESDKKIEDLTIEVEKLKKVNQEMEWSVKNKQNDIKKVESELQKVIKENEVIDELKKVIERLENDKNFLQEKLGSSMHENEKLNEELKKTRAILVEKERYINCIVKEEPSRLNIMDQFKMTDGVKRDNVKRNSIANTSIKHFQQANSII